GWRARPDGHDARRGRVAAELDAEEGMLRLARRDQLRRNRLDRVRRDREADAVAAARVALDLGVHADDMRLVVEQRPTGVAVVDRGVRLDRVVDREVV